MGIRDDLLAFFDGSEAVRHLVYGDVSTSMVLFAQAREGIGQEGHDAFLMAAKNALEVSVGLSTEGNIPGPIVVSEPNSTTLICSASEGDEMLVLRLASSEGLSDLTTAATALVNATGEGA